MNVAEVLQAQARAHPARTALVEVGRRRARTWTYAELDAAAGRLAARLQAAGIFRGDAVLVFVPMSGALYLTLIALFRLGAVAVFLDPGAGRKHLARCCALYPPKGFIGTPRAHLLRWITPALRRVPLAWTTRGGWPGARPLQAAGGPQAPVAALEKEAPALVTFTSGSTGLPKVAVRTHGFLLAQHRALERTLGYGAGDVVLSTLPIFVLTHLGAGVASLLPRVDLRRPGAVAAAPLVEQMVRHGVSAIECSPAILQRLVDHARARPFVLEGLRRVLTGGAPVFPRLLQAFSKLAPQAELVAAYGSTEAEPMAEVSLREMDEADLAAMGAGAGLLAGRVVEEVTLRILPDRFGTPIGPFSREAFAAQCLGADEPGEIVVSGEHVLPGYLHGRGDEETKFRVDGCVWHRTGDAGRLDARGRLWLLGRCGARIEDARGTLYPFAVEAAAATLPAVRRSALVARGGRRALAVEREPGSAWDEAALRQTLAWARIDDLVSMRIPVDGRHNAKVDYPALAAALRRRARALRRKARAPDRGGRR